MFENTATVVRKENSKQDVAEQRQSHLPTSLSSGMWHLFLRKQPRVWRVLLTIEQSHMGNYYLRDP